jgi:Mn2+/Fe2+ NRAMP family transporter
MTMRSAKALAQLSLRILARLLLLVLAGFFAGLLGFAATLFLGLENMVPFVAISGAIVSAGFAWAIGLWREGWITRVVAAIICLIVPVLLGGPGIVYSGCLILHACF